MKVISGGISAPKGFMATGAHIGIKKMKKDLCLLQSEVLAEFAGCFTTNKVKAAPVLWGLELQAKKAKIKGLVVISGNANACTGQQGVEDNYALANTFATLAKVEADNVLVCSTGVIGVNLEIEYVTAGMQRYFTCMSDDPDSARLAAEAIMTTDTFSKSIAVEIELGGKKVRIAGMAKGSGMIHPNMATLLSFITTDAAISRSVLDSALKDSVKNTYNMISVDGDTSTNDTVLIIANGMAENSSIKKGTEDYATFKAALDYVNKKLAIDIVTDGEGATKLIEVKVTGAATEKDARTIARSVTSSNLFKTMIFGADANCGRILCAMGYSGGNFNTDDVSVKFRSYEQDEEAAVPGHPQEDVLHFMEKSALLRFDEGIAKRLLSRSKIFLDIVLADGEAEATAWGCDLTYDYVKINGDYRS